jgi:hypothetical protein
LGIIMGSALALFAGLSMTMTVYLLLPEYRDRLAGEFRPLALATLWSVLVGLASVAAFTAEIRMRPWRRGAQAALAVSLLGMGWAYWPK